jgi:thiamine-phosphate pyrophosphorylase
MPRLDQSRLYTFIDTGYTRDRPVEVLARQLCQGGSDIIQLRAKKEPKEIVFGFAQKMVRICREHGVISIINDHLDIAMETGADGCHLGQEDFFDAGHRTKSALLQSPSEILLGLSSHAPAQADRAVGAGADYVAIGPVFYTPTKPTALAVTLSYVRWAAENIRLPWFAIGGINFSNVDEIITAGARRICVVSAILNAPDVVQACHDFKQRLTSHPIEI